MLLSKAKACGFIGGFEVGKGVEAITHLQFANDTILFRSSRWDEVVALKRILRCFELCLVLSVNLSKSMLVGVGCPYEVVLDLASKLHCRVGELSFLYLVLPIRAQLKSKAVWDSFVMNF